MELLIPCMEEDVGVEFMLSSIEEEVEDAQGESEPEEQPSEVVSSTRR